MDMGHSDPLTQGKTGKVTMPSIISIVGKSNSGKTTLIEKLVPELKGRGHRIGVIKHAHHGFDMDHEGKDSWRHKMAGADTVIVAAPDGLAVMKTGGCDSLDKLTPFLNDVDLVITEGFKKGRYPKIEIVRAARTRQPLCRNDNTLFALVTDTDLDLGVSRFELEDITSLADLIEHRFL